MMNLATRSYWTLDAKPSEVRPVNFCRALTFRMPCLAAKDCIGGSIDRGDEGIETWWYSSPYSTRLQPQALRGHVEVVGKQDSVD